MRYFLIYELMQDLPLILFTMPIVFFAIDILTPNPRKFGKLFGWAFAEVTEHIILPFIALLSIMFIGVAFLIVFIVLLFYIYGRVIGHANNLDDWMRVLSLSLVFLGIFLLPELVWLLGWEYGFEGWKTLSLILTMSVVIYLYFKRDDVKFLYSKLKNTIMSLRDKHPLPFDFFNAHSGLPPSLRTYNPSPIGMVLMGALTAMLSPRTGLMLPQEGFTRSTIVPTFRKPNLHLQLRKEI